MELIGGIVIVVTLAAATGLGWWAKSRPSSDPVEQEWSDGIK